MLETLLAVFGQVGIEIDGEQIAKTLPSRSTLSNWDTAINCLFRECSNTTDAGVTSLGITTDHAQRSRSLGKAARLSN
jgi:hypothetical protein